MNIHSFTHIRNIVMFSQWFLPITIVFSFFNEIESHLNHFNVAKRFILSIVRHVFFNFSLWVLVGMWYLNIHSRSWKSGLKFQLKHLFQFLMMCVTILYQWMIHKDPIIGVLICIFFTDYHFFIWIGRYQNSNIGFQL